MWKIFEDLLSLERPSVEDATYEELFSEQFDRDVACHEIGRRLTSIVHAMAFAKSHEEAQASTLTGTVFKEFVNRFPANAEIRGLSQTASIIRDVIGERAFYASNLPLLYYLHLPLYHLTDKAQRRYVNAMLDRGLADLREGLDLEGEIAVELSVSREEVALGLQRGWKELERIMQSEFERDELAASTESFLPWLSDSRGINQ